MVFLKMREKMAKMREKMCQPKMSFFYCWTFQSGCKNQSSKIFRKIIKKSHFYVVKFDNVQNAPYFWLFAQCAKALSKCARGGCQMRHFRAIAQDLAALLKTCLTMAVVTHALILPPQLKLFLFGSLHTSHCIFLKKADKKI